VIAQPGHKRTFAAPDARLALARAAFEGIPRTTIELDPHPFTVDSVRGGRFDEAVFLIGADEAHDFLSWKDPDQIVQHIQIGVANRSGHPEPDLVERYGDRVIALRIASPAISSREIRERVARGESIDALVPPKVAELIEELGLYRS
jgi:nicotinate-nucleotide adenylyltransferase